MKYIDKFLCCLNLTYPECIIFLMYNLLFYCFVLWLYLYCYGNKFQLFIFSLGNKILSSFNCVDSEFFKAYSLLSMVQSFVYPNRITEPLPIVTNMILASIAVVKSRIFEVGHVNPVVCGDKPFLYEIVIVLLNINAVPLITY